MKKLIIASIVVCFILSVQATPIQLEPFDQAFARFYGSYVQNCDDMVRELRMRLSPSIQNESKKSFQALEQYIQNIRDDEIPGVQRILVNKSDESLVYWSRRLTLDLVGFREELDRLIILNLAETRLRMDTVFLQKLKLFWDQEEYFRFRFANETAVERSKTQTKDQPR